MADTPNPYAQFQPQPGAAGENPYARFQPGYQDNGPGDVSRGFQVAIGQTVPLAKGAVGLVGASGEAAFGEGGIWSGIKNWGLKGYQEGMAKLAPLQKDTDSLTEAWDKAKEGNLGALVDWAQYGFGYAVGQLGESAAAAFLGGLAGGAVAGPAGAAAGAVEGAVEKGAVKTLAQRAIEGLVSKQAEKIAAAKLGAGATAEAITAEAAAAPIRQLATKTVARTIGAGAAMGGYNVVQEAGSIYPEAEDQAKNDGRQLDGADLARVWASSLVAASVETGTDALSLHALAGKVTLPGYGGRVARGLTGAAAIGAGEAGTEAAQTVIERYGAGQDITSPEGIKDIVDSAGQGAIGGVFAGGAGGAMHANKAIAKAKAAQDAQAAQQGAAVQQIMDAPDVGTAIKAAQAVATAAAPVDYEQPAFSRNNPAAQDALDQHIAALTQANTLSDSPSRPLDQPSRTEATAAALAPVQAAAEPGPMQPAAQVPDINPGRSQPISTPHVERPPAVYGLGPRNPGISVQRLARDRAPGNAEPWVDLTPMTPREGAQRLAILRDQVKQEGGDPMSLVVAPHPGMPGKVAIKSLDRPAPPVAKPGPGEMFAKKRGQNVGPLDLPPPLPGYPTVENLIETLRATNTPAAQAFVRDYDAGRISRDDVLRRAAYENLFNQDDGKAPALVGGRPSALPVSDVRGALNSPEGPRPRGRAGAGEPAPNYSAARANVAMAARMPTPDGRRAKELLGEHDAGHLDEAQFIELAQREGYYDPRSTTLPDVSVPRGTLTTAPDNGPLTTRGHELGMSWASQTSGEGENRNTHIRGNGMATDRPLPPPPPPPPPPPLPPPPPPPPGGGLTREEFAKRFGTNENNTALQEAVQKRSVPRALDVLANSRNPAIAEFAKQLTKGWRGIVKFRAWPTVAEGRKMLIRLRGRMTTFDKVEKGIGGFYSGQDDNVAIQPTLPARGLTGAERSELVVAHELAHAMTVRNFENPTTPEQRKAATELRALFQFVKTQIGHEKDETGLQTWYGLVNEKEMISEAFANPYFQHRLSQIAYGDKSLWTKFVEIVANLLGLNESSALTEVLRLGEALNRTGQQKLSPFRRSKRGGVLEARYDSGREEAQARDGTDLGRQDAGREVDHARPGTESARAATASDARPDPTAGAAANPVLRGIGAGGRGRLTGLGITAQLARTGHEALIGRTVNSPHDLAELAQVYRDPQIETFRWFFTKRGTIVDSMAVSSRMPGHVNFLPAGVTQAEYAAQLRSRMLATGADGYYVLHNHPSGDPTPSPKDIHGTKALADLVPGMAAHVVVNSNKYAVISLGKDIEGKSTAEPNSYSTFFGNETLLKASKPHNLLGLQAARPEDIAMVGKSLQAPGWVSMVGLDSQGRVRAINEVPADTLGRSDRYLAALVRRVMRQTGSRFVSVVGSDQDIARPAIQDAVRAGILRDAVGQTPGTVREQMAANGEKPGTHPLFTSTAARALSDNVSQTDTEPYANLRGRSVSYPVKVQETGETATMTTDAARELSDYDQRLSALERLAQCLG